MITCTHIHASALLVASVGSYSCANLSPHFDGNWTTRGYADSRIANSRTGHLADWSTLGLDNSRTSQLADWTTPVSQMPPKRKTKHAKSPMASASCPIGESSSPRVGNPRVGVSASCPVTILIIVPYRRIADLPLSLTFGKMWGCKCGSGSAVRVVVRVIATVYLLAVCRKSSLRAGL